MRKHKFLKPVSEELFIPNPKTGLKLRPEGELVYMSTYWSRRIKEGSVLVIEDIEKKEIKPKKQHKNIEE